MKKLKINLIEDWQKAWKYSSVWLSALGLGLLSFSDQLVQVWVYLPPSLSAHLPHGKELAQAVFVMAMIGRFLKFKFHGENPNGEH